MAILPTVDKQYVIVFMPDSHCALRASNPASLKIVGASEVDIRVGFRRWRICLQMVTPAMPLEMIVSADSNQGHMLPLTPILESAAQDARKVVISLAIRSRSSAVVTYNL